MTTRELIDMLLDMIEDEELLKKIDKHIGYIYGHRDRVIKWNIDKGCSILLHPLSIYAIRKKDTF